MIRMIYDSIGRRICSFFFSFFHAARKYPEIDVYRVINKNISQPSRSGKRMIIRKSYFLCVTCAPRNITTFSREVIFIRQQVMQIFYPVIPSNSAALYLSCLPYICFLSCLLPRVIISLTLLPSNIFLFFFQYLLHSCVTCTLLQSRVKYSL